MGDAAEEGVILRFYKIKSKKNVRSKKFSKRYIASKNQIRDPDRVIRPVELIDKKQRQPPSGDLSQPF